MSYEHIFQERRGALDKLIKQLISSRQIPVDPVSTANMHAILGLFASADFNNFQRAGAGEREGRVINALVSERHFGLAHGMGRSGSLVSFQPKAAGSNQLLQIAQGVIKHSLQMRGFNTVKEVLFCPASTGGSFFYVLRALKIQRVYWIRCDQKSIPKAIQLAGCECVVIDCVIDGASMRGDYDALERFLTARSEDERGLQTAILSTTSCFAPRQPDHLKVLSRLAKLHGCLHLVNNAYGIQSQTIMQELNVCQDVTLAVSSCDKNYLVPVGGAIIYSRHAEILKQIGDQWPGRASLGSVVDIFITLLQLGQTGWNALQRRQQECFVRLSHQAGFVSVPRNEISCYYPTASLDVGPKLYRSGVSGAKVNRPGDAFEFCGIRLENFGLHGSNAIENYLVVAAAVGMTLEEVDLVLKEVQRLTAPPAKLE